jgi:predicted acetyltransferase
MDAQSMQLVWPGPEYLPSYVQALESGWSPRTDRPEAAVEELERICRDPTSFLAEQVDIEGKGPEVVLPDGTSVPRLPGFHRWIWDGEFCGTIGFRWQPGTTELPPTCLGHIGYSVVPWKRRRGHATRALQLLLTDINIYGLDFVEITTDLDSLASQRVIEANGGQVIERFEKLPVNGGGPALRYRICLTAPPEAPVQRV